MADPGHPRMAVTLVLLVAAAACYVGIVAVRLGPPSGGDTVPLTAVTTALANGDLRLAASAASLPNPPGYPLLAAPFVAAFPSTVGSPGWCTPSGRFRPPVAGHRPGPVSHRRGGMRHRGDRRVTSALVPGPGTAGCRLVAGPGGGRPGPVPRRTGRLAGPTGRTPRLPGLPAGGQQCHRPAVPSPGHREPRPGPGRSGPDRAATVAAGRAALRGGHPDQAVRRAAAPTGTGGRTRRAGPAEDGRRGGGRLRGRDPAVLRRRSPGHPGEPQWLQCRRRGGRTDGALAGRGPRNGGLGRGPRRTGRVRTGGLHLGRPPSGPPCRPTGHPGGTGAGVHREPTGVRVGGASPTTCWPPASWCYFSTWWPGARSTGR